MSDTELKENDGLIETLWRTIDVSGLTQTDAMNVSGGVLVRELVLISDGLDRVDMEEVEAAMPVTVRSVGVNITPQTCVALTFVPNMMVTFVDDCYRLIPNPKSLECVESLDPKYQTVDVLDLPLTHQVSGKPGLHLCVSSIWQSFISFGFLYEDTRDGLMAYGKILEKDGIYLLNDKLCVPGNKPMKIHRSDMVSNALPNFSIIDALEAFVDKLKSQGYVRASMVSIVPWQDTLVQQTGGGKSAAVGCFRLSVLVSKQR